MPKINLKNPEGVAEVNFTHIKLEISITLTPEEAKAYESETGSAPTSPDRVTLDYNQTKPFSPGKYSDAPRTELRVKVEGKPDNYYTKFLKGSAEGEWNDKTQTYTAKGEVAVSSLMDELATNNLLPKQFERQVQGFHSMQDSRSAILSAVRECTEKVNEIKPSDPRK